MSTPSVTFAGLPSAALARPGQIGVLGIDHATPYDPGKPSHSAGAPAAIRAALTGYNRLPDHYDFDLGGDDPGRACQWVVIGKHRTAAVAEPVPAATP